MSERLSLKVLGDMAEYFGMFESDFTAPKPEHEKVMDGAELHCLYVCQDLRGGCEANCAYCTQGKDSSYDHKESFLINKAMVRYPMKRLVGMIRAGFLEKRQIKRICVSGLANPTAKENALAVFRQIRSASDVAITACYTPDSKEAFRELKDAGADRISINYEVATEELFERYRGTGRNNSPYSWAKVNQAVEDALEVFGPNNVGTHLLLGLGETPAQALKMIQWLYDKQVDVSLFAFRPVPGTDLEAHPPAPYREYHSVQLGRYLMLRRLARYEDMRFDEAGRVTGYGIPDAQLMELVSTGKPFRNGGGCPNCNRIHYETDPSQRYYNFPRDLRPEELARVRQELFP